MSEKTGKEIYIETLENFKNLMKRLLRTEYGTSTYLDLRTKINQERGFVETIIRSAGTSKVMSFRPPPMIGGYIIQNVNPFNVIFDPPYGVDVILPIIDIIDETIGSIKVKDNFVVAVSNKKKVSKLDKTVVDRKSIFLVHGHDDEIKEQVARFLEKLDLIPIILHEQANSGLTIIEKFESYSGTCYAIVLMTPDDVGKNIKSGKSEKLNPRARQNVIFELGYFFGKLGRRNVCVLLKGSVERPSDYDGIVYLPLDNDGGWKLLLIKELKTAGLDFDSNRVFD